MIAMGGADIAAWHSNVQTEVCGRSFPTLTAAKAIDVAARLNVERHEMVASARERRS